MAQNDLKILIEAAVKGLGQVEKLNSVMLDWHKAIVEVTKAQNILKQTETEIAKKLLFEEKLMLATARATTEKAKQTNLLIAAQLRLRQSEARAEAAAKNAASLHQARLNRQELAERKYARATHDMFIRQQQRAEDWNRRRDNDEAKERNRHNEMLARMALAERVAAQDHQRKLARGNQLMEAEGRWRKYRDVRNIFTAAGAGRLAGFGASFLQQSDLARIRAGEAARPSADFQGPMKPAGMLSSVIPALQAMKAEMGPLGMAALGVGAAATGIGIAFSVAQRAFEFFFNYVKQGLAFLKDQLVGFAQEGIRMASLIETQKIGIGASISYATGVPIETGMLHADKQLRQLQFDAAATKATYEELLGIFNSTTAATMRHGISLDQSRKLTVLASQAAGALGVEAKSAGTFIAEVFAGSIRVTNPLVKRLGKEELVALRDAVKSNHITWQQFADGIEKRLSVFGKAGALIQQTGETILSNLKDTAQIAALDVTVGLYRELKSLGQGILAFFIDLKEGQRGWTENARPFIDMFRGFYDIIGDIVSEIKIGLLAGLMRVSDYLNSSNSRWGDIRTSIYAAWEALKDLGGTVLEVLGLDSPDKGFRAIHRLVTLITWGIEAARVALKALDFFPAMQAIKLFMKLSGSLTSGDSGIGEQGLSGDAGFDEYIRRAKEAEAERERALKAQDFGERYSVATGSGFKPSSAGLLAAGQGNLSIIERELAAYEKAHKKKVDMLREERQERKKNNDQYDAHIKTYLESVDRQEKAQEILNNAIRSTFTDAERYQAETADIIGDGRALFDSAEAWEAWALRVVAARDKAFRAKEGTETSKGLLDDIKFATEKYERGVNIETLSMQGGAQNQATTQAHIEKLRADARADADRLDASLEKAIASGLISSGSEEHQKALLMIAELRARAAATELELTTLFRNIGAAIGSSLSGAIDSIIDGTKSMREAFSDMAKAIVKDIQRMIVKFLIYKALMAAASMGKAGGTWNTVVSGIAGAFAPGKAAGGLITGPGTGTSDSIPTLLSNREYVVKNQAVEHYGVDFMDAVNNLRLPKFADGGLVSTGGAATAMSPIVNNEVPVSIVNLTSQDQYDDFIASPRGHRAIMNVIGKNPNGIKRVLK